MPYGSNKRFYRAANNGETPMGREDAEVVQRGGAGTRRTGEHLLGSGMASKAAKAIRRRRRMLEDI